MIKDKIKNVVKVVMCFFIVSLTACVNEKKDVKEEKSGFEFIADVESTLPGALFYDDGCIIWYDARPRSNYMHVLDARTGNSLGSMGKYGQGPQEFTMMLLDDIVMNRCFYGYDINDLNKKAYFSLDSLLEHKDYFIREEDMPEEKSFRIKKSKDPNHVFTANYKGVKSEFGTFPIKDLPVHFSGGIGFNSNNECLVHYVFDFPYLAMYKNVNGSFERKWIKTELPDYDLKSETEVVLEHKKRGIKGIAMLKDYIIAKQQTKTRHESMKESRGLDVSTVEQTVFVYDYDGNLLKILDFGVPIIRVSGDINTNTLYMIVADPDFKIVRSKIG